MKRSLEILGALLGVAVLVGGIFVVNLVWFKPFFINHFFDRVFISFAVENPELLTSTRILKPLGLDFYHDDLADQSDAHAAEQIADLAGYKATLLRYDDADLDGQQRLSKKIMLAFLDPQIALGKKYLYHDYPINQLFGYQNTWPSFMTDQHWIEDEGDVEAYLARMRKVGGIFEQLTAGMTTRAERGITPPTFVVDKVLKNLDAFLATPVAESALLTTYLERADKAGIDDPDLKRRVEATIIDHVYPAYARLRDFMRGFRSKTNTDDGVWKLPDGEAFYDLMLWQMTTTRISARDIHERGLAEVDRIQGEMLAILEAEGYPIEGGFEAAMKALSNDPQYYFTEDQRSQILGGYAAIIEEIEGQLDPWFNRRHRAKVEVKRVPEFREETAPGAYYQGPPMDGSVPGRFYANLYDLEATPKWGMRTLAYHEAVPGHHLQVAVARELEDLPVFRKLVPFTAFSEGWALYAERLAYEMGLEEAPLDNLGRLQAELFRSVRLVVDTGIHRFKWSRERAIDYMQKNLGTAESDVEAEIERYIVMPGQATAYKVGMDFILEQRAKAKAALGDAFDIRRFHDAVLENGAVPLSVLEEQVDAYIRAAQPG